MNSITTFAAAALVLFAIGQGILAARADEAPKNHLHNSAGELQAVGMAVQEPTLLYKTYEPFTDAEFTEFAKNDVVVNVIFRGAESRG
jgi:hypothetical protein